VEIGTPVAFWARADARRMFSITGVTPAVSVGALDDGGLDTAGADALRDVAE